jgi:hypothetical protein
MNTDRYKEGYTTAMMDLIDCFIRLQCASKKLSPIERIKQLLLWRKQIAGLDWLEELHPNYYEQIMTKETGPWAEDYFD